MSRIAIPAIESGTGATADIYAQVKKIAGGRVPNTFAALGRLAPASLAALLNAEGALASGSLSQQELQTSEAPQELHFAGQRRPLADAPSRYRLGPAGIWFQNLE
jgi:hypothetical protein